MPRYIEESDVYKLVEPTGLAKIHCSQIDALPRADVVPASEVAKEFTCFVGDPHKVEHCPYLEEIEKAKGEVAREIFGEIEKCSEVALMNGHIETPILCIGFGVLAELKKKYTEGVE